MKASYSVIISCPVCQLVIEKTAVPWYRTLMLSKNRRASGPCVRKLEGNDHRKSSFLRLRQGMRCNDVGNHSSTMRKSTILKNSDSLWRQQQNSVEMDCQTPSKLFDFSVSESTRDIAQFILCRESALGDFEDPNGKTRDKDLMDDLNNKRTLRMELSLVRMSLNN